MAVNPIGRWLDIVKSVIGRRLSVTAGTADSNYDEISVTLNPSGSITNLNDVVGANFELNHFVNMKGLFKIHFHWWQVSSNAHVFTFKYRVQKNGEAKTTAWTDGSYTVGSGGEVFTYTSGTLNQISSLITLDLNALGVGVSDIIQFKLTRTDAIVGDIDIVMLDAHVQQDGAGSLTEYSKAIN